MKKVIIMLIILALLVTVVNEFYRTPLWSKYTLDLILGFIGLLILILGFGLLTKIYLLKKFYYDPKLSDFLHLLLLIVLLIWISTMVAYGHAHRPGYGEAPFPKDLSFIKLLLNVIIAIFTHENLTQPLKKEIRIFWLIGIFLIWLLITFYLAAYKEKLDRKIKHSRLKDKPEGLILKNHLIFIGEVKGLKEIIKNLNHAKRDLDMVVVSEKLHTTPFIGIDRIYPKVWGIEGEITDPDIANLADLQNARFAIFVNLKSLKELMITEANGRKISSFVAVYDRELYNIVVKFLR